MPASPSSHPSPPSRRTTWLSRRERAGQTALPWDAPVVPPASRSYTTVPFTGRSAASRHHSYQAGQRARAKDGTRAAAYLELLRTQGPQSDHEAAEAMHCPLSTINGLRNRKWLRPRVEEFPDVAVSPNGCPCSRWGLRAPATGRGIDTRTA